MIEIQVRTLVFIIGMFIGMIIMFLELTVSRRNWVSYREWSNKNNLKNEQEDTE